MNERAETPPRGEPHRWKKGQISPNPAGRPPAHASFTAALREKVEARRDELLERLVDDAVQGNTEARKLLLERLVPTNRSTFQAVAIPGLSEAQTLGDKLQAVQLAMAAGALSADHAKAMAETLQASELAMQLEALRKRVEELQAARTIEVMP